MTATISHASVRLAKTRVVALMQWGLHVRYAIFCGERSDSRAYLGELIMRDGEFIEFVSTRRMISTKLAPNDDNERAYSLAQRITAGLKRGGRRMTAHLLHPIAVALSHERRRRQQLPPFNDLPLTDDAAPANVREPELEHVKERL